MASKNRQRMIQEMDIRGHDPKTKKAYIHSMVKFVEHFGNKDPESLGIQEIKDYQQYLLIECGYAARSVNRHIAGIRFFYTNVLKMWWVKEEITRVKAPKFIPTILSEEEIARMIDCTNSVFYKAVLMVLYSSGIRHNELRSLKTTDVDSNRMVLNIRGGKGGKDRQALLSPLAYRALRSYWLLFRMKNPVKSDFLFTPTKNSHSGELKKKLSHTAVGYVIKTAVRAGDIKKKLVLILFVTLSPSTY